MGVKGIQSPCRGSGGQRPPENSHQLQPVECLKDRRVQVTTQTHISEYPLVARGKVRDIYAIDDATLLIVTTDRMSAFDVIMSEPIPYKGVVLNQITLFWMEKFAHIIPNHILEHDVARFPQPLQTYASMLEGRSVLVRRAAPLLLECVVRGYLSGSGWNDYKATGSVCGHTLPAGLQESCRLEKALFTASTKAELGEHDMNINRAQGIALVGEAMFDRLESVSLRIFTEASAYAGERGIIIADTKFEFGMVDGSLYLIDEVLTPDSSRFWPQAAYQPGQAQPSFDKQYLRDWLLTQPWDKTPPPPALPREVIEATGAKYREAYTILTGTTLNLPPA